MKLRGFVLLTGCSLMPKLPSQLNSADLIREIAAWVRRSMVITRKDSTDLYNTNSWWLYCVAHQAIGYAGACYAQAARLKT